jgi:hypothetical protein
VYFGSAIVGVGYATLELRSRLSIAFNAIQRMDQPNMNLKN